MTATPSIDAFDAQMLDFSSDPDVPMHITGFAEPFAESLMDHDGQLVSSAYAEHASVEVDMEEYVGDNAEYEMADETAEFHRPHGDDLLDIEVYDASHAPSPLVPPQSLQPPVDVQIDSGHPASTDPAFSKQTTIPELQGEPESEAHPVPLDHPAADATHVEPSSSHADVSSEAVASELAHPTELLDEGISVASESHEQLGDTNGQLLEAPPPADMANEAESHAPCNAEEHTAHLEEALHETSEPLAAESTRPATDTCDGGPPVQDEKVIDQAPVSEGEIIDPYQLSDGVYIDPPPAVLLSVADLSEPSFALFNQPVVEDEFSGETGSNQKAFSLLLENRPTLYYESLNNVFDALRQDEVLLSRVPHSFEGELVLDAYDLQLAVSEDNVHSREISLHDLDVLHDGSDFVGPLRLLLRAIVPRFIIRYYALQEQIQRLNVAAETEEGEHDEEQQQRHSLYEEHLQPHQEEAADHPSTHVTVTSEGVEVPPTTEVEESARDGPLHLEPTEDTEQQDCEAEDTSASQEPEAEYHEAIGEAAHALEDEDNYSGTNAGEEDETGRSKSLDADQDHDATAEDTDALATVTGHGSEFGGEQTEYLDYVQPEEFDERYGEDLLERAGGQSPVQYGEPSHHEEEGEQDTSTAVDESQAVLPGSGESEVAASTPIPTRAALKFNASEPADVNLPTESALPKQEKSVPTDESSTKHTDTQGPSGNQEASIAQAKLFSETEESDLNLLSTLEREAEAEFEQTFSAEQGGQEISVEAALHNDETWDEWDDEDAEGEDEEDWIDPDAASNESSVTLESKASSKRGYDEVEPSEEPNVEYPNSPGKRPRVQ